jgi:hypothetical protein
MVDFQPLEDKLGGKLVSWDGKNTNGPGRGTLVNFVLTSQDLFHVTLLRVPPGCITNMNKIKRALLWADTKNVSRPQDSSPCGSVDMGIYYASSTITIGNHNIAPFWESPWLNGRRPKDIALLIFRPHLGRNGRSSKPCMIELVSQRSKCMLAIP